MVRDPVCGMVIAEAHAKAVRHVEDASIYFCSTACAQQFDASPEHYTVAAGCVISGQVATTDTLPAGSNHAWWQIRSIRLLQRPMLFGLLAMVGLLAFYVGIITLAQGWGHAIEQLTADRWFVGVIAAGFGAQIGRFTYLRGLHAPLTAGGMAASTGMSTTAMLACCAHHLADILPILGVAGAAAFLNTYKVPMLWLGIAMNLIGIIYLLRKITQHRALTCQTPVASRSIAS
jgi:YHS domain-containing protein